MIFVTGCGNNKKQLICKMNAEGSILPEIVATLDSNDKISEIEIHTVYESEERAQSDFESFKSIHGDNASINKNVIIVKNAQDPNTFFGSQYSKTIGYTIDEFQTFLGDYTCE
jgi:hypothetical protein